MELMNAKGVRDFTPKEKILRQQVIDSLRSVFEEFGFNPIETPIIERYELLSSKYAGGEEILKEIFKLKDQGGRKLALRYDLTVPFARFISMNPTIKMPFKRYQIGRQYYKINVFNQEFIFNSYMIYCHHTLCQRHSLKQI